MAATPDSSPTVVAFVDWMQREGFALRGIRVRRRLACFECSKKCGSSYLNYSALKKVARFQATGRGIQAWPHDLEAGTCIFRVPRAHVMTAGEGGSSSWEALAVRMLDERDLGQASPWAAYLAALPTRIDLPMTWPKRHCAALRPSAAAAQATADRRAARDAYAALPPPRPPWPQFIDALSLISAYSFTLADGATAMVPMADLLNARAGANNARLHFAQVRPRAGHMLLTDWAQPIPPGRPDGALTCLQDGSLEMIVTKRIPAGAEAFNTYGRLPAAALLCRYGYQLHCKVLSDLGTLGP